MLSLEDYFEYHPPATDARRLAHEAVNKKALEFAQVIHTLVDDEDCQKMALFAVQQARMFANQGLTVDELKKIREQPTP
jgi:hypothetical protein